MDSIAERLAVARPAPDPAADHSFDVLYRTHWWPMLRLGDGPIAAPDSGRSHAMTFLYVPASNPPLAVLVSSVKNVAASRCPGAFRIRAGHAYVIHCQVTFRAGVGAGASFTVTRPHDRTRAEIGISSP